MEYSQRFVSLIMLGSLFFEKVVYHYNMAEKAERFSMFSEIDLLHEEKAGLTDFAEKSKELATLAAKAHDTHVSMLKGVYEGFQLFCSDIGINAEDVQKTLPIQDCCHDIHRLLTSAIHVDISRTESIRKYFLELWDPEG